ncbi:hypothetical protein D9M69_514840 [compost metagenome]
MLSMLSRLMLTLPVRSNTGTPSMTMATPGFSPMYRWFSTPRNLIFRSSPPCVSMVTPGMALSTCTRLSACCASISRPDRLTVLVGSRVLSPKRSSMVEPVTVVWRRVCVGTGLVCAQVPGAAKAATAAARRVFLVFFIWKPVWFFWKGIGCRVQNFTFTPA